MDRRRIAAGLAGVPPAVDVVVAGLGITGTGAALDAASRGLSVLAVDAHDLAFGTSRWSSKLVHGGLRYLAAGQLGVAHESAVERGILLGTTAPHLTRPLANLLPLTADAGAARTAMLRAGLLGGDLLRAAARTPAADLPRPRRVTPTEALALAPGLRVEGLRGGLLWWDGQLEDDARLVTTVARTAVAHGAEVRTRARVLAVTGGPPGRGGATVVLRDELSGATTEVAARAVVNATGVWAGGLAEGVRLRPSRGTHLVLRQRSLPGVRAAVTVPVPGSRNRFVLVLPQPDGTHYVGLTDEPAPGPLPDVPVPTTAEVDWLLASLAGAFARPPGRGDVVGAFAGLRPLLDAPGASSDLSRRHAVLTGRHGVVTVVGGKLTTYRRMARDAVDAAVEGAGLDADRCRTATLPLAGAASRAELSRLPLPARLVRRYGADAALVLDVARRRTGLGQEELTAPVADGVPATLAELVFAVTDEGAHDVDDLLDRRTRVGLVAADRALAVPAAERALALVAAHRVGR